MTEYWHRLRRLQRVQDSIMDGEYRLFLTLQSENFNSSSVDNIPSVLVDFLEHAGFTSFIGSLTRISRELSENLSLCSLLIVYAESKQIYFSQRKALEKISASIVTILLLPESLSIEDSSPPPSNHYAILSYVSSPSDKSKLNIIFENIFIGSMALAMESTNGCICADDVAFCSNDKIKLLGSSNPKIIRKIWGNFGPEIIFRCLVSVHAEKKIIVDAMTIGGLLKMILPKARVQLMPDCLIASLIFIISSEGKGYAMEAMNHFTNVKCSLTFDPITSEGWLEITCHSNPQLVLEEIYNFISPNYILDIRIAYSFEVLASVQTFLTLKALSYNRKIPDEELGIAIEEISMWQFTAITNNQAITSSSDLSNIPTPINMVKENNNNNSNDTIYAVGINQLQNLITEILKKEIGVSNNLPIYLDKTYTVTETGKGDYILNNTEDQNRLSENLNNNNNKQQQYKNFLNEKQDVLKNIVRQEVEYATSDIIRKLKLSSTQEISVLRAKLDQIEARLPTTEICFAKEPSNEKGYFQRSLDNLQSEISELSRRIMNFERNNSSNISNNKSDKLIVLERGLESLQTRISQVIEVSGKLKGELDFMTTQLLNRLEVLESKQQQQQQQPLSSLSTTSQKFSEEVKNNIQNKLIFFEEGIRNLNKRLDNSELQVMNLHGEFSLKQEKEDNIISNKIKELSQRLENIVEEVLQALQKQEEVALFNLKKEFHQHLDDMTKTINEELEYIKASIDISKSKNL